MVGVFDWHTLSVFILANSKIIRADCCTQTLRLDGSGSKHMICVLFCVVVMANITWMRTLRLAHMIGSRSSRPLAARPRSNPFSLSKSRAWNALQELFQSVPLVVATHIYLVMQHLVNGCKEESLTRKQHIGTMQHLLWQRWTHETWYATRINNTWSWKHNSTSQSRCRCTQHKLTQRVHNVGHQMI